MKEAKIIVLAGQSNALGVSRAEYLLRNFTPEQIEKYYNGYSDVKINYISQDTRSEGFVNTCVTRTACTKHAPSVGPDLGIAQWFTEHPDGASYFIVKCAYGGVSLFYDWLPPSGGAEYDANALEGRKGPGWCYNELVQLLESSLVWLKNQGYTPSIQSFCWMQGETDAEQEVHAKDYIVRYHALISDFEKRFNEYTADCKYLDGGISASWAFHKIINEGKQTYAKTHRNCVYIDTIGEGLTVHNEPEEKPDLAHYDSESAIRLGTLFARFS